jgi:transposase
MSMIAEAGLDRDRRRRIWSEDRKREIVAESLEPGASVAAIALRHGINANLLFTWRRQSTARTAARPDGLVTMMPVMVTSEVPALIPDAPPDPGGRMEIVLAGGDRVVVGSDVDAAALARVIKALSRR